METIEGKTITMDQIGNFISLHIASGGGGNLTSILLHFTKKQLEHIVTQGQFILQDMDLQDEPTPCSMAAQIKNEKN